MCVLISLTSLIIFEFALTFARPLLFGTVFFLLLCVNRSKTVLGNNGPNQKVIRTALQQ